MTCNSLFRISSYKLENNQHIITFIEQHREFTKVLDASVPVSENEGTLEDVAVVAWNMVKDEFDAWRNSLSAGISIVNRYFDIDANGALTFTS